MPLDRIDGEAVYTPAEGERVQYRPRFLRSIGAYTGPMGQAVGTIERVKRLGAGRWFCDIAWDNYPEGPRTVAAGNLWPEGEPCYSDV